MTTLKRTPSTALMNSNRWIWLGWMEGLVVVLAVIVECAGTTTSPSIQPNWIHLLLNNPCHQLRNHASGIPFLHVGPAVELHLTQSRCEASVKVALVHQWSEVGWLEVKEWSEACERSTKRNFVRKYMLYDINRALFANMWQLSYGCRIKAATTTLRHKRKLLYKSHILFQFKYPTLVLYV